MIFNRARVWSNRLWSSLSGRRTRPPRKPAVRLSCEALEDRLTPATHTWTGLGADANWTTAANWDIGAPNSADDVLVFPAAAQRLSNVNNFAAGTTFQQLRIDGSNYNLSGNLLRLSGGIASNTAAGSNVLAFPIDIPSGLMSVDVSIFDKLTVSGVVSGAGGLSKSGSGELILTRANTFQGDTTVANGDITLQNASALGASSAASGRTTVLDNGGASVRLAAGIGTVPEHFVLTGTGSGGGLRSLGGNNTLSGSVTTLGTGTLVVSPGATLRVTGALHGGDFSFKASGGQVTLAGASDHTGATTVLNGTLRVENSQALGSAANGTDVRLGATLELANNVNLAESLTIGSSGVNAGGALRRAAGTSAVSGSVTLQGNSTIFVNSGNTLTLSGVVGHSTNGALTKTGLGKLVLSGSNDYPGFTDIREGVVNIQNGTALGSFASGTRVAAGATLEVQGFAFGEPVFLNGAGTAGSGALRQLSDLVLWLGDVTLESPTTVRVDGTSMTMSGVVNGVQAATFTKTGTGRLGLSNINTFEGQLLIQQGAVRASNGQALGGGSLSTANGTVVSAGAALELDGSIVVQREFITLAGGGVGGQGALRSVSGSNVIDPNLSFVSVAGNVTIGVDGGQLRTGANTVPAGTSFTKVGAGTWVAANVFGTPPVTVAAGELQISGTLGAITVNNTGTLSGLGTVQGNLTVNAGGTVSPGVGDDVSSITVNGNVTFDAGSTYRAQMKLVGSAHLVDQIRVTGSVPRTVSLSNPKLDLKATFDPAAGTQFRIIDNQTTGTTVGQFLNLPPESIVTSTDGIPFRITYFGGTGNDTVLTRNTPSMVRSLSLDSAKIRAGQSAHLTGQLTDPDPGEDLKLVVDWGDGSPLQVMSPGLDPFSLNHQYAKPGHYSVWVGWFDEAGEGRSRVLPLRVQRAHPGSATSGLEALDALFAQEALSQD
jgi:fibronectin-binding autotransporter adhesin